MKMMNKHAYLILAHNDPELLKKLVSILDDERYDIYIHIDKKNYHKFKNIDLRTKCSNVEVFSKFTVNWGGFSIVKAELFLLEKALKSKHTYYHLLSGQDLPIKNNDEIYCFFENNGDFEYVFFETPLPNKQTLQRISLYHWLREYCRISKCKTINQIIHAIEKNLLIMQRLLGINRKKYYEKFQRGSQWISITEEFANRVIEDKEKIYHDFSYSFAADEMIFQTVAENYEAIKKRLYQLENYNDCIQNMRYIDWERGGPYTFGISDLDDIKKSPYMFARKFSSDVDNDIIDAIYDYVKAKN